MKSLFHQGTVLLSRTIFDSEWDICKIKSTLIKHDWPKLSTYPEILVWASELLNLPHLQSTRNS